MSRFGKLNAVALICSFATWNITAAVANEEVDITDEMARINYSLGYQIGGDFKRQGVEMDAAAVVKGIEDALAGGEPLMGRDEMHATLVELKRKVTEQQREKRRKNELKLLDEGKQFMAENAAKAGVEVTESGLQYRVISPGTGPAPEYRDSVTVNYVGRLVNGSEFDSGESVSFRLDGVIRGWSEGMQLIREGGRIELVIPPQLAYGQRGAMAHRTLVFDVELLSVNDEES